MLEVHKFERNRRVDKQLSTAQQELSLPENFEIGKAVGQGDCFFDAVAQGLKQLKPNMEFTIKSLRQVCKKLAVNNQQLKDKVIRDVRNPHDTTIVSPDHSVGDDELWNAYLASIEYTSEDIEGMKIEHQDLYRSLTSSKYGSVLQAPIWGRSEIEGQLICSEYNVKLHIVEKLPYAGWSNQIVDESSSKSIADIDYNEANTIHIVNRGNSHFEPILNKAITRNTAQVSNIDEKDENPEPMEVEQPGTSERAGKKRPYIGEEDQSMVKKPSILPQEEDKLAHEYVKYFTIKFQTIIEFYKNYQGKTFLEMMNRDEGKRIANEILSGVVSALPGIFTHDAHKHGAIPAMTSTSKNISSFYASFIIESLSGEKKRNIEIKKKLEAITKDKSDEDLNKEVLEAAATIFYMYKTTLLKNHDNVKKLAEVAVDKIILYIEKNTVEEIGNIKNVILEAIKQEGELVEEHLKVYDEPTDPFTQNEIEKAKRLKENVLSELKPNKALDKVEVQKVVEEALENFYKKKESEKQPPKDIMFDLNEPIENFTGREKDLKDLHEKLSGQGVTAITQKLSELAINSRTSSSGNLGSNGQQASVSGLGGIGKTQLALKYAKKYSTDYDNNVIWINAQDISDSFERLASKLGIAKKDVDDDEKKTHDLAQEIYEHFKEAKSLFIFDNVENYRQIEKFLPKEFAGNKPSVLITSRYRNWENTKVKVLDLDVFTPEEAKEFIKGKLKIESSDNSQDEEIKALAEKLERLPLALAQAVAYIEQSKNTNSEFGINDYLEKYDRKAKELLGSDALEKSNDPYTKTVLTTWQVTLDKIKAEGVDGQKAIEILNIMAYFNPDEISNEIFLQLESSGNVDRAIQLLKDYSMINGKARSDKSNVHRLVQEVVRINLKENEGQFKEIIKQIENLTKNFNRDKELEGHFLHFAFFTLKDKELMKKLGLETNDKRLFEKIGGFNRKDILESLFSMMKERDTKARFIEFIGEALCIYLQVGFKDFVKHTISYLEKSEEDEFLNKQDIDDLVNNKKYSTSYNFYQEETLKGLVSRLRKEEGLTEMLNVFENFAKKYMDSVTPMSCSSSYSSQRKKRSANVLCWEDIDEFNEADKPDKRNPNKIKIDSKKFIDYLKGAPEEKQDQLIQLAGKVEVTGDTKEAVGRLVKYHKIKSHLRKVGKFSHKLNSGLMVKNIGADIINGDYEDVAVNLGLIEGGQVFGEAADKVLAKGVALEADKKLLGRSLKATSPFLKRGTAGFFAYDLINQIREYEDGNKDALSGIISNGIFVGMDTAEAGVEAAEFLEVIEGISEFTGPIGEAIGASIFLGMEIYHARKQVEEIEKHVHLTKEEELTEGVRAFFGMAPSKEIEERMEVKERNNQLVKNATETLKNDTNFARYVFSVVEKKQDCKMEYDWSSPQAISHTRYKNVCNNATFPFVQNSFVDLREKERYIKISDSAPDEGSLFCFEGELSKKLRRTGNSFGIVITNQYTTIESGSSKTKFLCEGAVGVEYKINRTGNKTLIALDEGKDTAIGTPNFSNFFIVNNGHKNYTGGSEGDTFTVQGSNITGILNGMGGIDTLDLRGFGTKNNEYALIDIQGSVCSRNDEYEESYECKYGLKTSYINQIYGRKSKADRIHFVENLEYLDGLGGENSNKQDYVKIPYNLNKNPKIVLRGYTKVVLLEKSNKSVNFIDYIIPRDEHGKSSVSFSFKGPIQHRFHFDYSILNLREINIGEDDITFNFFDQSREFSVTLINYYDDSRRNYPDFPVNVEYLFQGNTKIKILNKNNFYAEQSTNKTAEETISEYAAIANRLKMTMQFTLPNNETVLVGHGAHEIMHNNPLYKSHLVGNGGKNVYVITSAFDTAIPEVTLYNLNTGNFIDTLDLRQIRKQVRKDLGKEVEAKMTVSGDDLLIELLCFDIGKDFVTLRLEGGKFLYGKGRITKSLVKVRLKDGMHWYQNVHVIINSNPMKIDLNGTNYQLKPLSLHIKKDYKYIVIQPNDIEEEGEIVIEKEVDNYTFARLRNDLIITNVFDQEESQHCTILLKDFYQEQKMRTVSIKFADKEINLRQHGMQINNATNFDALQEEHKNVRGIILNTTGLQKTTTTVNPEISTHHIRHEYHNSSSRNRRAIDENREENVVSAATRTSLWINVGISWLKKPITNTYAAAKGVYSSFADYVRSGDLRRDCVNYFNVNLQQVYERQMPGAFKLDGKETAAETIFKMGEHYFSQVDNGTITLLDLLIRKITGQKYISTADQHISLIEAQSYALNITEGLEKAVKQAALKSGMSMHRLNIDFGKIQKEVTGKIMGGKVNEIPGILESHIEQALPSKKAGDPGKLSPKKFNKFMTEFNRGLNIVLNQSIQQVLSSRDSILEVSDEQISLKPKSYLNDTSVQSHVTQDRGSRNQSKALIP